MPTHKIPQTLLDSITAAPSPTKTKQVAAMQNYIQGLLGDTHHTFLQGSYRNDTAVSDINDVDIVAIRLTTYSTIFTGKTFSAIIPWENIFSEIEKKLRNQQLYNWTVTRRDKCIEVRGDFNADVVPAVQVNEDRLIDPIVVYSFRTPGEKLNFPRIHYNNGVAKNAATGGIYKPTVRMFKNWVKNHFADDKATISSFKMEAMVHATADSCFYDDPAMNFAVIGNDIAKRLTSQGLTHPSHVSVCGYENIFSNWDSGGQSRFRNQFYESILHSVEALNATSEDAARTAWKRVFKL